MGNTRWCWVVASLGLPIVVACGDGGPGAAADLAPPDDAIPAPGADALSDALDTTRPDGALQAPEPFYRIDVGQQEDGSFQLIGASRVLLDYAPVPGFLAQHVLVSRAADGSILDAVAIAFPTTGHSTEREEGVLVHTDFDVTLSMTTAFLPASADVDRIELINPEMAVGLSVASADITDGTVTLDSSGTIPKQSSPESTLTFLYPNIEVLGPGDESKLPEGMIGAGSLVPMTEAAFDVIAQGLQTVTPIALSTVRKLGIVHWSAGSLEAERDLRGRSVGPYVVFSDVQLEVPELAAEGIQAVVHEVAHSFAILTSVASSSDTPRLSAWPAEVISPVRRVVERYALTGGIETVWGALHDTGVTAGYASDYIPGDDGWRRLLSRPDLVLEGGFAGAYGSKSAREDLATFVGTLQYPTSIEPGPCARFGGSRLDEPRATTYAKLVLLRGVGLISEDNFRRCVQGTSIQPGRGIDFGGLRKFETNVRVGITGSGIERGFDVLADGPNDYEILIHIALGEDRSPLGLHLLQPLGLADIGSAQANQILLLQGDTLSSARASGQGFVLVSEYTDQSSQGAVFGLELENSYEDPIEFWPFGMFSGSP